jgi:hypothetical protein
LLPNGMLDLDALYERFSSLRAEAKALAIADGYSDPCDAPRKPEEAEDDQLDRLRRAVTRRGGPLPRDLLLDSVIADTQEQQEHRRAQERAEVAAKVLILTILISDCHLWQARIGCVVLIGCQGACEPKVSGRRSSRSRTVTSTRSSASRASARCPRRRTMDMPVLRAAG